MKKIFHGSLVKVETPEIRTSNRTLDYGSGFYTTTSSEQAEAWVRRKMKEHQVGIGYVNEYLLDEDVVKELHGLFFKEPSEEWLDFVMANRTEKDFTHSYDIVHGPVANDKVYAAFALYEGGILDKSTLIKELKAYRLVDQYLFHSPGSLRALTFIQAKEISI